MFGDSPVNINPRPASITPQNITFLGLTLSTRYPTSGDRKPFSICLTEKTPERTVLETPKSRNIGRKYAVKPCHMTIPK